jgi:hypothetical protein
MMSFNPLGMTKLKPFGQIVVFTPNIYDYEKVRKNYIVCSGGHGVVSH